MKSRIAAIAFMGLMLFSQMATASDTNVGRYSELLRSDLRTKKVSLITQALDLTREEGDKFWPIYREYDQKLSKIIDTRIANIRSYAANYDSMTNAKAADLVKVALKIKHDRYELQSDYYKKIAKATSEVVAARFLQVETVVNNLVDLQIGLQLPLIPKLVPAPPNQ